MIFLQVQTWLREAGSSLFWLQLAGLVKPRVELAQPIVINCGVHPEKELAQLTGFVWVSQQEELAQSTEIVNEVSQQD